MSIISFNSFTSFMINVLYGGMTWVAVCSFLTSEEMPAVSKLRFYGRTGYTLAKYACRYGYQCIVAQESAGAEVFVDMLTEMAASDILIVKVLQALAFNAHVIDTATHARITQYTDNVPYEQSDIDIDVLMDVAKNPVCVCRYGQAHAVRDDFAYLRAARHAYEYEIRVEGKETRD